MRFRLFLPVCLVFLYLLGLGRVGLIGPDEPRYAQVAREMLQTRDFITPHLNGEPWFEKPPLYYWAAAASFALFGVNETAARLPCALAASCFLILFGWAAHRLYHRETGRYSVLVLACSAGWVGFARAASPEILFTAAAAGAFLLLGLWLWQGRESSLYGFYGLLALSTLAKGLTAVPLAVLALAVYCAAIGEWNWLYRVLRPGPLLLFAIVGLPWYAAVYAVNGTEFLRVFFWRHHFERFVTQELAHPGPWWYYLPVLLGLIFPWTPQILLVVLNLADLGWKGLVKDHRRVFLAAWIVPTVLFFSISQGKLPGYVLVVIPALALWIGQELVHARPARVRWVFLVQALLLPVVLLAAGVLPEALSRGVRVARLSLSSLAGDNLLTVLAIGGAALLMVLAWRARRLAACLAVTAIVALCVARIIWTKAEAIDQAASARPVAREIQARGIPVTQLTLDPHARRELEYGLDFYLDCPVPRGTKAPFVILPDGRIVPLSH